ncbi:MAG TPA: hypothetical protein VH306_15115 [Gaiellaceae bacterium]|jgi:hypothetical protein
MAQTIVERIVRGDGDTGPLGEVVRVWQGSQRESLYVRARARLGLHEPPDPPWVLVDVSEDGGETWTEALDLLLVSEAVVAATAPYSPSADYRVRWVMPEPPSSEYATLRVWLD